MKKEIMKNVAQFSEIRELFCDDVSKNIYDNLVFFRLTGRYKFIHKIVINCCSESKNEYGISDLIEENRTEQNDKIILFGAAPFADAVYTYLDEFGIRINGIVDNDKNKQGLRFGYEEFEIQSPKTVVPQNLNAKYLVTAIDYFVKESIKKELLEYGVKKENIVFALTYYGTQYFDDSVIKPKEQEVFLDCGSLDCITCLRFREWVGGNYNLIYSFEPDLDNLENCKKNIEKYNLQNIELLPYGVWDKKDELHFFSARGGSSISNKGEKIIKTISIDEVLNGEEATFIKMDIEGAELNALIGAKETIKKWHPRLAISIYHKPEDLIEIPEYIRELDPNYKFYLRHYSSSLFESVLYAI